LIAAAGLAGASRCWQARDSLVTACVMVAVHIAVSPLTRGALLAGFVVGWVGYALLHRAPAGGRAPEGDGDGSRSG